MIDTTEETSCAEPDNANEEAETQSEDDSTTTGATLHYTNPAFAKLAIDNFKDYLYRIWASRMNYGEYNYDNFKRSVKTWVISNPAWQLVLGRSKRMTKTMEAEEYLKIYAPERWTDFTTSPMGGKPEATGSWKASKLNAGERFTGYIHRTATFDPATAGAAPYNDKDDLQNYAYYQATDFYRRVIQEGQDPVQAEKQIISFKLWREYGRPRLLPLKVNTEDFPTEQNRTYFRSRRKNDAITDGSNISN